MPPTIPAVITPVCFTRAGRATQNQMLLATVERIWLQMDSSPLWQQFNVHIASRAYRLKWLGDRQTLLAALRRRDVMGARQAMWQHLENVKNSLLEALR